MGMERNRDQHYHGLSLTLGYMVYGVYYIDYIIDNGDLAGGEQAIPKAPSTTKHN